MSVILTLFWHQSVAPNAAGIAPETLDFVRKTLDSVPGLTEAQIFTPATAVDIYTDDGASPPLGLQLHFVDIAALEAAAGREGALQPLCRTDALPGLDPNRAEAQAFLKRDYPMPEPEHAAGAVPCSFVVHYPGPAQDVNAWLAHYIAGHPQMMRRMPGIRAMEILTPVDWVNGMAIPSVRYLQRNRVLFDSPEALTQALESPVRHELRQDFDNLPAFEGGNKHYAMFTQTYRPC